MKSDVVAKKKFGQNFLKDDTVLHKIVEAMPNDDLRVVEIGPGLGDLTKHLVNIKSVSAFEVDTELCEILEKEFAKEIKTTQLTLHCGDVLESWQSTLVDEPYNLVANLPYYIATNIILKALADPNCKSLLVMIQKEVALKFSAQPNEKVFCALSVIAQSVWTAHIVTDVPPSAFEPAPKVTSAVLKIVKTSDREVSEFEQMLRVAFTQPRKTLQKNLSAHYQKQEVLECLNTLGLEPSIRPHQVTTADYHQLFKLLK